MASALRRPVQALASPSPVIAARGLTKVYRMGDVEVVALQGVDLELFEGELVVLSARPAVGSRPCSTSWVGSTIVTWRGEAVTPRK